MPNKEGGFAPNDFCTRQSLSGSSQISAASQQELFGDATKTPTATVDVDSGIIVDQDVLSVLNEDKQLVPSVLAVQENFGLETPSPEVLADGLMTTGENLAACEAAGIELFSPAKSQIAKNNPAVRSDPTEPVPAADHDKLPTRTVRRKGETSEQLDKQAFAYDSERNCYILRG